MQWAKTRLCPVGTEVSFAPHSHSEVLLLAPALGGERLKIKPHHLRVGARIRHRESFFSFLFHLLLDSTQENHGMQGLSRAYTLAANPCYLAQCVCILLHCVL